MDSLEGYNSEEDEDYIPGQELEQRRAEKRNAKAREAAKAAQLGAAVVESDEELDEAFVAPGGTSSQKTKKKKNNTEDVEEEDDEDDEGADEEAEEDCKDALALASKRKRDREAEDLFASLQSEDALLNNTEGEGKPIKKMKLHELAQPAQKRKKKRAVQAWEKWMQPAGPGLADLSSLISDEADMSEEAEKQDTTTETKPTEAPYLSLQKDVVVRETDDALEVTELKEYAGKTVTLRRTIAKGSAHEEEFKKQRKEQEKAEGNLGNLLAHLTKSKTINTVEKSRVDWEEDKRVEGDGQELTQHTRSTHSYISQQEFLQEADYAKFEQERAQRDDQRRQRDLAAAAALKKKTGT
eukprot:g23316.t1